MVTERKASPAPAAVRPEGVATARWPLVLLLLAVVAVAAAAMTDDPGDGGGTLAAHHHHRLLKSPRRFRRPDHDPTSADHDHDSDHDHDGGHGRVGGGGNRWSPRCARPSGLPSPGSPAGGRTYRADPG